MTTIMLVDDDPMVRGSLGEMLERAGYAVLSPPEGGAALEALQGSPVVDLVIADYRMPGMDGLSFIRRLKETKPHLPVIVLTGHGDLESYQCATGLDVVRYLSKPVGWRELQRAVREAVHGEHFTGIAKGGGRHVQRC